MSFQDIKGQDRAVHFFKSALRSRMVSSAYLFSGPEGSGKRLLAHTLSKALNCLKGDGDSCDSCESCLKIENKNHPDVVWIDMALDKEGIGIGQVRELQRQINLKPYEGRQKVFIIQNAHLMTQDAANCLLKTLEEPPGDSVIILITSKPEELLSTVRSRCKHIKLDMLALALKVELTRKRGFSEEEALFLSRLSNSGIEVLQDIEAGELFGLRNRVLDEFSSGAQLLDEKSFIFSESKDEMKFAVSILESWFRDALVLKAHGWGSAIINSDRQRELGALKERLGIEALEGILEAVENTFFCISRNVGAKIALNNLKMRILEMTKQTGV